MDVPQAALLIWFGVLGLALLVGRSVAKQVRRRLILGGQNIPYRPSTHLLLGDGDIFKANVHRAGQEWSKKLNTGIYWRRMLHYSVVVISDPELMAQALDRAAYPEYIDKPSEPMFYKVVDETTANPPQESHLTAATSDPLWRAVRKGTAPAFNPNNMRNAFGEVSRTSKVLIETLLRNGPERPVNIDGAVQCQAFDVIGSVGFGKRFEAAADLHGEGAKACQAVEQGAQSVVNNLRNPLNWIPFTKPWRQHRAAIKRVLGVMRNVLQEVHDRGTPPVEDESIAAQLMRVRDDKGNLLPHARQWSELSVFFYAGMETTAHTMAWTIYCISQHPHVEAKVVEELEHFELLVTPERPQPRPLEYADLARLTYLNCVIREVLRIRPVLPILFRRAMKDLRLGRYLLPEGTIIELHMLAMNTHPLYWDRPDEFLPERWLEPGTEYLQKPVSTGAPNSGKGSPGAEIEITVNAQSTPQSSFTEKKTRVRRTLPFGDGARACIGMPLAKVMLATNIGQLMSHFTFRLADSMGGPAKVEESEVWRITMQPLHGLFMHCIPRGREPSKAADTQPSA